MTFHKRRTIFLASLLLYIVTQFICSYFFNQWRGEFAVFPVLLSAILFGLRPTLIIAPLLLFPFNILLCFLFQIDIRTTVLRIAGISGNFAIMLFGFVTAYVRDLNVKRKEELTRLKHAEDALKTVHNELEQRIKERTSELWKTNEQLRFKIEERKQTVAALRVFSDALENSTDAIGMSTPQGDHYYQNKTFDRLFGKIGKNPPDTVYVDKTIGEKVFKSIRSGGKWSGEVKMYAKDGQILDIDLRAYANKDDHDNIISLVGVHTDITERKQSEQERARLSKAIEQAVELIMIMDAEGTVQYVNPAVVNLMEYNTTEIIGANIFKTAQKLRPDLYNKVFTTINKGQHWTEILTHKKKSGKICLNETTISPIFDSSGTLTHLLSIARDVTNEVELEMQLRQSQKMESIGILAGGIAHDFNNILAGIIGYTELTKDNVPKNSPVVNYLNNTLKLTSRAGDLVSQILTFSRKNVDEEKPIDITPILKDALTLLRSTLPLTIEIEKNIDESSAVLFGDPSSIHQIVMNLVTNAAQSMKEDTGTIRVSLTSERLDKKGLAGSKNASPGMFVKLTVQDNGSGIDSLTINHIFDPFFTTKEVGKGTGMGLSVVHGIVIAHGGLIKVNSVLNKGTTFNVFIPKTEMKAIETDVVSPQAIPGTANILFVDDEELLTDIAQNALSPLGYNVTVSNSALDALKVIEKDPEQFDLVITDLSMPKMSGLDFSKRLLEFRPKIPVILCSGNKGNISDQSIKDAGIRATIMKPFTIATLSKIIFDILNEKES